MALFDPLVLDLRALTSPVAVARWESTAMMGFLMIRRISEPARIIRTNSKVEIHSTRRVSLKGYYVDVFFSISSL